MRPEAQGDSRKPMGISGEYNLAALYPELATKWHPTKNGSLVPDQILPYSNKNAWWACSKGHEWEARVASVTTGSGCPYCAGCRTAPENSLVALHPELAKEWHPARNATLLPGDVSSHSGRKVWWVCSKGHEWSACTFSRTKGSGCPYCSGLKASKEHCLQTHDPELAKEWHPERNGKTTPADVTLFSGSKRWWLCKQGQRQGLPLLYRETVRLSSDTQPSSCRGMAPLKERHPDPLRRETRIRQEGMVAVHEESRMDCYRE
jgi:hypothetical protein